MRHRFIRLAGALSVTVALTFGAPDEAAGISLIRDAEIENTIRDYATPLFRAAGLDSNAVRVHLVNDSSLNAFVAGGMRVFIHTGLLLATKSPGQLIGVIAHETGHIAGGHLARTNDMLRGARTEAIVGYILGLAVAIAGAPEAGQALILGGQALSQQSILKYSRSQEQAADQFAVTVLERTGQSARGLIEFLEIMGAGESAVEQNLYLRTHPLTKDRMKFVTNQLATSVHANTPPLARFEESFRRMQAKLRGFLDPPARTLARYPGTDQSLEARYARAVAYHLQAELSLALGEIDSLLADLPRDPYFHELKGQILFESGRVSEAVKSYRRAVELLPDAPLLRVGLAHAMIETGDPTVLAAAAVRLEVAVRQDRDDPRAWRLLSIAYGRIGRPGLSVLASAERALLTGRYSDAVGFSKRAAKLVPYGSPSQLRAADIQRSAEEALKKNKKRRGR